MYWIALSPSLPRSSHLPPPLSLSLVNCLIMQKTGAGLHTASSCYWDNSTDGQHTHTHTLTHTHTHSHTHIHTSVALPNHRKRGFLASTLLIAPLYTLHWDTVFNTCEVTVTTLCILQVCQCTTPCTVCVYSLIPCRKLYHQMGE